MLRRCTVGTFSVLSRAHYTRYTSGFLFIRIFYHLIYEDLNLSLSSAFHLSADRFSLDFTLCPSRRSILLTATESQPAHDQQALDATFHRDAHAPTNTAHTHVTVGPTHTTNGKTPPRSGAQIRARPRRGCSRIFSSRVRLCAAACRPASSFLRRLSARPNSPSH